MDVNKPEQVVDGEHVRVDAVALEPLARGAIEVAGVAHVALGHAPLRVLVRHDVERVGDLQKVGEGALRIPLTWEQLRHACDGHVRANETRTTGRRRTMHDDLVRLDEVVGELLDLVRVVLAQHVPLVHGRVVGVLGVLVVEHLHDVRLLVLDVPFGLLEHAARQRRDVKGEARRHHYPARERWLL